MSEMGHWGCAPLSCASQAMYIVYIGLSLLAILTFFLWNESGKQTSSKPHPTMGLPAGYHET
eukprot:157325-Amphidinium_carterae.1